MNDLWTEIVTLFDILKLDSNLVHPWFDCYEYYEGSYDMPASLGNKGLIPIDVWK